MHIPCTSVLLYPISPGLVCFLTSPFINYLVTTGFSCRLKLQKEATKLLCVPCILLCSSFPLCSELKLFFIFPPADAVNSDCGAPACSSLCFPIYIPLTHVTPPGSALLMGSSPFRCLKAPTPLLCFSVLQNFPLELRESPAQELPAFLPSLPSTVPCQGGPCGTVPAFFIDAPIPQHLSCVLNPHVLAVLKFAFVPFPWSSLT